MEIDMGNTAKNIKNPGASMPKIEIIAHILKSMDASLCVFSQTIGFLRVQGVQIPTK
jgi:hypothetical protein